MTALFDDYAEIRFIDSARFPACACNLLIFQAHVRKPQLFETLTWNPKTVNTAWVSATN
ncbi:hypothetical protein CF65_02449 [Aggregatibacter actinomycetemcomitans HK1651]|nr:hypothetical protein CF65_02449 [Aggregatibacter actinomycetemcomitans HK1651]